MDKDYQIFLTDVVNVFVPLQDFTGNSDIDWSKPIPDIDKQLYKKYNLTAIVRGGCLEMEKN